MSTPAERRSMTSPPVNVTIHEQRFHPPAPAPLPLMGCRGCAEPMIAGTQCRCGAWCR